MNSIENTLKSVMTFAVLLLTAIVIAPAAGTIAQDINDEIESVDQRRSNRKSRQGPQSNRMTLDVMPDSAARFTLKDGNEMYFLDGQLYTFAVRESVYVAIPTNRFAARGPTNRSYSKRSIAQNRRLKKANWKKSRKRNARKRHSQWHRQHNRRFHEG